MFGFLSPTTNQRNKESPLGSQLSTPSSIQWRNIKKVLTRGTVYRHMVVIILDPPGHVNQTQEGPWDQDTWILLRGTNWLISQPFLIFQGNKLLLTLCPSSTKQA